MIQLSPGHSAAIGAERQANLLGKCRRVRYGKVSILVTVSQHPEQKRKPGVGRDGAVRLELRPSGAGGPSLLGRVCNLRVGPVRNVRKAGDPIAVFGGFARARHAHQQHHGGEHLADNDRA